MENPDVTSKRTGTRRKRLVNSYVILPYVQGTPSSYIFRTANIMVYVHPHKKICDILVAPKDSTHHRGDFFTSITACHDTRDRGWFTLARVHHTLHYSEAVGSFHSMASEWCHTISVIKLTRWLTKANWLIFFVTKKHNSTFVILLYVNNSLKHRYILTTTIRTVGTPVDIYNIVWFIEDYLLSVCKRAKIYYHEWYSMWTEGWLFFSDTTHIDIIT